MERNLSWELNVALKAQVRAAAIKCKCSDKPLIMMGLKTCTCDRGRTLLLAKTQVKTVRDAIKEANRKETA